MKRLILMTLSLLLLSGCDADGDGFLAVDSFLTIHEDVELASLETTNKRIKALKTQADYDAELAIYSNDSPYKIDFSKNQVLLVDMGHKNREGFGVKVKSIEESEGSLTVNIIYTEPGEHCDMDFNTRNPYIFVAIAGTNPLTIRDQEERGESCDPSNSDNTVNL